MALIPTLPSPLSTRHRGRRSRALFHWRADDYTIQPLAGPTMAFARISTGGLVRDRHGRGRLPAYGAPRYHCVDLDGDGVFETPTLLIEERNTNLFLRSQEFDNAAWAKTRASISANAVQAPDGTLTADKLVEDNTASSTHFTQQVVTVTAGKRLAVSAFVRPAERSQIQLRATNGSDLVSASFDVSSGVVLGFGTGGTGAHVRSYMEKWYDWLGFLWYRCVVVGVASTSATAITGMAFLMTGGSNTYSGDGTSGLYIWGAQIEETDNDASTYLPTTTATVQRAAESLTGTWPLVPGPLTMYASLVEMGGAIETTSSKRIIQIGDSVTRVLLMQGTAGIRSEHDNGPTSPSSTSTLTIARGDALEALCRVDATGAIQSEHSVNAGALVTAAYSVANPFAAAWGGSPVKLAIGSQEGTAGWGLLAFRSAKIAAGARTMDEMREML